MSAKKKQKRGGLELTAEEKAGRVCSEVRASQLLTLLSLCCVCLHLGISSSARREWIRAMLDTGAMLTLPLSALQATASPGKLGLRGSREGSLPPN